MTFLVGWGCCKLTFRITEVGNNIHLIKCLYLRMIKWRCALSQKNLIEGISAYAYLFMFSFFGGGGEKWGMKDEKKKKMTGEGVCPSEAREFWCQKRKWKSYLWPPYGFINEIFGVEFFMTPPLKLPSPPPADKKWPAPRTTVSVYEIYV